MKQNERRSRIHKCGKLLLTLLNGRSFLTFASSAMRKEIKSESGRRPFTDTAERRFATLQLSAPTGPRGSIYERIDFARDSSPCR
jgi:hypothetical protein